MQFNQSFRAANLKHSFNAMNPFLALVAFVGLALVAMVILPFILLFLLLSFITFQLFGRKVIIPKMKRAFEQSQRQQGHTYQSDADIQREPAAPYADMFSRTGKHQSKPNQGGRTFEHQAD
ncbi:hypothetical protein [Shewanella sp. OMA3-2]|uniref:hypothetical protein n=1 Tax=Shewanella sp. OMA3-2 TaxID=2908650 RepID=UPI001F2469DA|nr:hypothetical protein [Shewanella sp. OMA3-2]UJF22426.1 hypothetical protein L0B17_03105 [Shewanella sp. OMA3-2]